MIESPARPGFWRPFLLSCVAGSSTGLGGALVIFLFQFTPRPVPCTKLQNWRFFLGWPNRLAHLPHSFYFPVWIPRGMAWCCNTPLCLLVVLWSRSHCVNWYLKPSNLDIPRPWNKVLLEAHWWWGAQCWWCEEWAKVVGNNTRVANKEISISPYSR